MRKTKQHILAAWHGFSYIFSRVSRSLYGFILIIAAFIPVVAISAVMSDYASSERGRVDRVWAYWSSPSWGATALAVVCCVLIYHCILYVTAKNHHRQMNRIVFERRGSLTVLLLSILLTLCLVVATAGFDDVLMTALRPAGGLFDIIMGIIAILGIYMTLAQVLNINNSIVSFKDLINRVDNLVRGTPEDDVVMMMIWTPAMGCVRLKEREWTKLTKLLASRDKFISLTCLQHKAGSKNSIMAQWLALYEKSEITDSRVNIIKEKIELGLEESTSIINSAILNSKEYKKRHKDGPCIAPLFARQVELPRTYMIANQKRAIVAVPLNFPTETYDPWQHSEARARAFEKVEFVGFETRDYHVIESVREEIMKRREHIRAMRAVDPFDEDEPSKSEAKG